MHLEYSLIFLLKKKCNVSVTCEIDPREKAHQRLETPCPTTILPNRSISND